MLHMLGCFSVTFKLTSVTFRMESKLLAKTLAHLVNARI